MRDITNLTHSSPAAPAIPHSTLRAPQSPDPLLKVPLRLVGVIGKLYVVLESDRGLVLLDQHAAHERILFEQMLGRGTRKGEKFSDKSHFTVFDCFDGTLVAYFRDATAITAEPGYVVPRNNFEEVAQLVERLQADSGTRSG